MEEILRQLTQLGILRVNKTKCESNFEQKGSFIRCFKAEIELENNKKLYNTYN